MSRNLMPKSGAMAPYVVVNRDAAVAGVFSVDGEAGAVVLTSKYLQISKYTIDKAATDASINSINESIGNINTALGGINTTLSNKAAKGANSDITELNALTKAITLAQGGTGANTLPAAKINLEIDRFNQFGAVTSFSSGDKTKSVLVDNSGVWGGYDELTQTYIPLSPAVGGTGATSLDQARVNLKVQNFYTLEDQVLVYSPDSTKAMAIANNRWGFFNTSDGSYLQLPVAGGGTGASTDKGARNKLNTPVGGRAIGMPNDTDVLAYFKNAAESGYYSCGSLALNLPEAVGWCMFDLHVHGINSSGVMDYGNVVATTNSGNTWLNICDMGNWLGWKRIFRSDNRIELTGEKGSALGEYSIAIGDNDSGIKWDSDGHISAFADSRRIFAWTPSSINTYYVVSSYVPNEGRGLYVNNRRTGSANALVAGQVESGAFSSWRDRAAGILVELPNTDAAMNIWKATKWGIDHQGSMDVVMYSAGGYETRLNVKGAFYSFNDAGYASAVQWVSTSDIRLKKQLAAIGSAKEKVKKLKGYTYFKRNNLEEDKDSFYSEEAGLIAQEVQKVLPEAVYSISNTDYLGISYSGVTALLTNAINEVILDQENLQDTITKQGDIIKELSNEVSELKELVKQLLAK